MNLLPLDLELNFENEPYENVKYKIESYISNYKHKAILYIFRYLKESMDKRKFENSKSCLEKIKFYQTI